jgi:hypothetical protein
MKQLLFALTFISLLIPRAAVAEELIFKAVKPMFIAALADPTATSGRGAETWGLWRTDPGHTGVWLRLYPMLKKAGNIAPGLWSFDIDDWWLDENGLIMKAPEFPIPAGKYLVTGERETIAALTIHPTDETGNQNWELNRNATMYDVTHLPCRSTRYTPKGASGTCTPANVNKDPFPLKVGLKLPKVDGCEGKDYSVMIVVGLPEGQFE